MLNNFLCIHTPMIESFFDGMVSVEEVDEVNLKKLMDSDLLKQVCNKFNSKMYDNELKQLMAYTEFIKDGFSYVKHSKTNIGRSKTSMGIPLLGLRKAIRQTICKHDDVIDIDMDNAHPSIMLQMLMDTKIPHSALHDYVNDRQKYRDVISECWDLPSYTSDPDELKSMPKTLMLRLMYGGCLSGWEKENGLKKPKKVPVLITNFIEEFKNICKEFEEHNPDLKAEIEKVKDYNITGSLVSSIMQQKESQLLEVMVKYLIRRGYIETIKTGFYKFAPCADGLIISKKRVEDPGLLLTELCVAIFVETGFIIKLSIKEMDLHLCDILDDHFVSEQNFKAVNKVDRILKASDDLFNAYANSKYFQESMIRNDVNTKNIELSAPSNDVKCILCNLVHKVNHQKLYYNANDHACLSCHKKKIIIERYDKKEVIKADKEEQGTKYIEEFYESNTVDDSVTMICEDSRYLSCDNDNIFQWRPEYDNPFIVLDAQMGKGKTRFILNFLRRKYKTNPNASILVVSQRKTFTHFICDELKEYKIKSYLDVKNSDYDSHNSLAIQIESLHKIRSKVYDYIILDEVETIMNQFSSTTMEHVNNNFDALEYLISQAEATILADAFMNTRTMEYLKSIKTRRDKITLLKNTQLFLKDREAIQINGADFIDNVITALKSGKKIALISTSREDLLEYERAIRMNPDTQNKKIKYYDKCSNKDDLKDVNEAWSDADIVMYTPVITTGISYTNEKHVFDTIYINCKNTCLSRDMMQMIMRIRTLRENKVYFALSSRQMFGVNDIVFKPFDQFTDDIRKRGNEILKITSDKALKERITECMTTFNPKLLRVMYYNMREQGISNKHFQQLTLYLFRKQGYKVIELEEKSVDSKVEKLEFDYVDKYENIDPLEYDEVRSLKNKDTDEYTQLRLDKYYFENMLVKNLQEDVKSKLFFDYYQNMYKKSILENLRIEKSNVKIDQLVKNDLNKNDDMLNKMNLKSLKLTHIKKMNKILTLQNSCQNEKVIKKNNGLILNYLIKNVESINIAFGTKYAFTERNNIQNNLIGFKMLQKMYTTWSGLQFKVHEKTKRGTQSYITQANDIFSCLRGLCPSKSIEEQFLECE